MLDLVFPLYGALKEEIFQIEVAGGNDINQEVPVKHNAIENDSNDKRVEKQKLVLKFRRSRQRRERSELKNDPLTLLIKCVMLGKKPNP
ncbi:hypothetical protein FRX31_028691 [Thalictrum thalictroides]|uniref:Uncharacterized protein n=1 Tax=Thalictrum thalictroides TaxID=46969 RepID=A0A7J6VBH4_THATH|nr:hypothetical protein FRX31_028691 [Thalictrum thalictroides]